MKKNRKLLGILSFLSISSIVTSIVVPYSMNTNNNTNLSSIKSHNSFAFQGITNIAPNINAVNELSNKYPVELLNSNDAERLLKDLIISSVINPSSKLTQNDISIDRNKTVADNFKGTLGLVFKINNYKAVINNGMELVQTPSKEFSTTIQNLQIARPSTIPTANQEISVPDQFKSYTNAQAVNLLSSEILPTIVGGSQMSIFSIEVRNSKIIFPSKLSVSMIVSNYFDTKGDFINYSGLINFTLSDFKPLVNSSINTSIDVGHMNLTQNKLTLENAFPIIKENVSNLARELTINDIANFKIEHLHSELKSNLSFDIINSLWIENDVIKQKPIQITFTNLKEGLSTTINDVIRNSSISMYTSSEVKATSDNDWTKNSTIKSIIASSINNPAPNNVVNAVDISIKRAREIGSIGNDNFSQLYVEFDLTNFSGLNADGKVVSSLPLQTTIQGFKTTNSTSINTKVLARISDTSSSTGIKIFDDVYPTELSEINAKQIIASNIENSNGLISPNDIEITKLEPNLSNAVINVEFKLINDRYVDADGNILNEKALSTQIFGFKFFGGATSFGKLANDLVLQTDSSFLTPVLLPGLLLQNTTFAQSVVRSFITGPVPSDLNINISNVDVSKQNEMSFNATITNYFSANGLETAPKTFTGIKLTNLPSNSPAGTYNLPIVQAKHENDQKIMTIEDFRPLGNDFTQLQQLIVDRVVQAPFGYLRANDIEIVSSSQLNPIYSAIDNSIDVTFKIINNKYKDPNTQQGTNSPEMKVKIVNFDTISCIDIANYTMESVNNPELANEYSSEYLKNNLQVINTNQKYTQSEKNILLQNELSKYVKINLSDLNLSKTRMDFVNDDRNGQLNIILYSSNFYAKDGSYTSNETLITNFTLTGFAKSSVQDETSVTWLYANQTLDMFASDLSLLNVSNIVKIDNLPIGVKPVYSFVARDSIEESTQLLNYGEVDVTLTLSSYFDANGDLVLGTKKFQATFKTKAFLNTTINLSQSNVLVNYNNKDVLASNASDAVILNIIAANLTEKPNNFNTFRDISIIKINKIDDKTGEITLDFKLNKYFKDGVEIIDNPLVFENVVITGFYKVDVQEQAFKNLYQQQWFILLIAVTGGSLILLLVILLLSKIGISRKRY